MDNQPPVIPPEIKSPEPTPPVKIKHAPKFIFGYLALILLIAALGGVYSWQHKKVNDSNAKVASLQSQLNKLSKEVQSAQTKKPTSTTAQTPNPYAGWKTYTLPVEKLSFMYPSGWTVANTSPTSTQDDTTLTSSDGFTLNISDGGGNGGDSITEAPASSAIPVTFVGQPDYFVFTYGTGSVGQGSSDGLIHGAVLQTNTDESAGPNGGYPWPTDKYAHQSDPEFGGGPITPGAPTDYISVFCNLKTQITLQQAPSNSDFKDAELVIASMHY